MASTIDPAIKDALLNLLVSEITRSSTNHIYDYIRAEIGSSRPNVLATLLAAALQEPQNAESDIPELDLPLDTYETLLASSDSNFHVLFRIKRSTVQNLVGIIEKSLAASTDTVDASVPVKKKVLLTCWLLGNTEQYSSAAAIFGVKSESVYPIFQQICRELCVLSGKYIFWPSADQCGTITEAFEDQYGFPGVIGVIGYCHIRIKQPDSETESVQYLNEKSNYHTTILQAVCDDKMIFQNVCVGFPGRCSPSRVLVGSPLYGRLTSRTDPLIEPHKHILGSSCYPQLATLITPYSAEASGNPLNEQQCKFNNLHEKARCIIDQTFTMLKARFSRLQYIDVPRPDWAASKVVLAACVLHNFALLHNDEFEILSGPVKSEDNSYEEMTTSEKVSSTDMIVKIE